AHVFTSQRGGVNQLQCRWGTLIEAIAADSELRDRTRKALTQIREQYPLDPSPDILLGLLASASKEDSLLKSSSEVLLQWIDKVEAAPSPDPARSAQWNFTSDPSDARIAVWLIARECLKRPALMSQGQRLGDISWKQSQSSINT